MPILLCLTYPNGRTHETVVDHEVGLGDELTLYGHRWKIIGREPERRGLVSRPAVKRLVCHQIDA